MIVMGQISDCIFLSLLWLLGCFPIVTIGASTAALYDAVVHVYRKEEKHSWARFIHAFKQNFKSSVLPTCVFLPAFGTLALGMIRVWNGAVAGTISWMLFSGVAFLGVVAFGVLSVLFPLLSRFENSFGILLKNTVLLALANLPRTVGLGIVNTAALFLCVRYVFPLFFLPALAVLIGSLFLEAMFKPYIPEETSENAV